MMMIGGIVPDPIPAPPALCRKARNADGGQEPSRRYCSLLTSHTADAMAKLTPTSGHQPSMGILSSAPTIRDAATGREIDSTFFTGFSRINLCRCFDTTAPPAACEPDGPRTTSGDEPANGYRRQRPRDRPTANPLRLPSFLPAL